MRLKNKNKKVDLLISESLMDALFGYGIKAYPNEFGGLLIGFYSDDFKTLHVTDTILPKKYKGKPYSFERSIDGITKKLEKFYGLNPKQYYIGEWHTHPNGPTNYSQTDLNSMIEIVNCETVNIKNPVLLILSIGKDKAQGFTFYLYENEKLHKYE